jgi:hypothetical protein
MDSPLFWRNSRFPMATRSRLALRFRRTSVRFLSLPPPHPPTPTCPPTPTPHLPPPPAPPPHHHHLPPHPHHHHLLSQRMRTRCCLPELPVVLRHSSLHRSPYITPISPFAVIAFRRFRLLPCTGGCTISSKRQTMTRHRTRHRTRHKTRHRSDSSHGLSGCCSMTC